MMLKTTIFNVANSLMGRKFFLAIFGVLAIAKMYEAQIAELENVLMATLDLVGDNQTVALSDIAFATSNAFGFAVGSVALIISAAAISQAVSDKGSTIEGPAEDGTTTDTVS